MNILIVDDQKAVVDSLKNGIHWEKLPVRQVYTACSAKEAKLVLRNFDVDVLLTDIEMPEEDGLSLCRWMRERFDGIECIFLTSHADFSYAREAIGLGGFDYILQPVRYEEVEKVLLRVAEKIRDRRKIRQIMDSQRRVMEQRNSILDAMLSKLINEKVEDANQIYNHFKDMFQAEYENCQVIPILVQIVRWKKITEEWDEKLVRMSLCNIIEEIFQEEQVHAGVSSARASYYWLFVTIDQKDCLDSRIRNGFQIFYDFINENMDFSIALYPAFFEKENSDLIAFSEVYQRLMKRAAHNADLKKGIYTEDILDEQMESKEDPIELAIDYIRKNVTRNISRTDVADYVHLNEEYFSRLFRQQTGATFKEFLMDEKMKAAKHLLKNTRLSVSIIASKTGYDNFSHFSKMFKKVTNQTPQEYRKAHQDSEA